MIKFLIGFFGWPFFIKYEVDRNYTMIEKDKQRPNYLHSFFVRAFFGFLGLVLMVENFDPGFLWSWLEAWPYLVYEISSFYLVFDVWLNLRRNKPWDYQGKNSGWLDRLHPGMYYGLKIVCAVGLIVSIIRIWQGQ